MSAERCYLAVADDLQDAKNRLAHLRAIVRITDHDTHLKIIANRGLGQIRGLSGWSMVEVVDQTEHWDVTYWGFAMAAFRHARAEGHENERALSVMIHYLCNLFLPNPSASEAPFLRDLADRRDATEAAYPPERAHGWELDALKLLGVEDA